MLVTGLASIALARIELVSEVPFGQLVATYTVASLSPPPIRALGIDMHTKDAAAAGETAVRLDLVAAWRESTVFTEAERAALALAEVAGVRARMA